MKTIPAIIVQLRDQSNGLAFTSLQDGQIVSAFPSKSTVEVVLSNGTVGSVAITLNGSKTFERRSPWVFNGDAGVAEYKDGKNDVTVELFEDTNGKNPVKKISLSFFKGKVTKGLATQLNQKELPIDKVDSSFKDLGVQDLRSFLNVSDWSKLPTAKDAETMALWVKAGYRITLTVTTAVNSGVIPTTEQATKWFTAAAKVFGPYVYIWSIGNEPNLRPKYWGGSLKDYMDRLLIPASKILRAAGFKVAGGGISEKVDAAKSLVDLGILQYVDYFDFHPYGGSASEHVDRIKAVRALIGNTPLILTEWNIHGSTSNKTKWAAEVVKIWPQLAALGVVIAFYYRSITKPPEQESFAADAAVLTYDKFEKNQPFYDAVASLK